MNRDNYIYLIDLAVSESTPVWNGTDGTINSHQLQFGIDFLAKTRKAKSFDL